MAIRPYVDKDGKRFFEIYLNVRTANGGRKQIKKKGFKSEKAALNNEFELKRGLYESREKTIFTWEEWHKICLDRIKVEFLPSTAIDYDCQISKWVNPVWRARELQSISPSDVHSLIYTHIQGVSPNTRRNVLKKLKRLFQTAVDDGLLDRNPALPVKVKVPEVKQAVLNASEVNILLREARNLNHRFKEIWSVALFTGMRSGELWALKWSDLDFENKRISVNKSWCCKNGFGPTKNSRNRIVPICNELLKFLKELKIQRSGTDEFVLPHLEEWERGEQAAVLRIFCQQIGITSVKFHDLRATFITQLLLRGVPLAQVMAIVGHSELKTTNEYLRIAGVDVEGATDKLSFSLPQDQLAEVIQMTFGSDKK